MKVPFKTFNPPVMNHPNFARIVSILILIGFSGAFAQAKSNRVAVRAEATKDYTLLRERDKSAKVQTYHLAKGLFLGGNVVDGSLDESSFEEIADELGITRSRVAQLEKSALTKLRDRFILRQYYLDYVSSSSESRNQDQVPYA